MLLQYINTMRFLINNPKYVCIITKQVKARRRLLELPGRLRKLHHFTVMQPLKSLKGNTTLSHCKIQNLKVSSPVS